MRLHLAVVCVQIMTVWPPNGLWPNDLPVSIGTNALILRNVFHIDGRAVPSKALPSDHKESRQKPASLRFLIAGRF
jgi:hypothetical protein